MLTRLFPLALACALFACNKTAPESKPSSTTPPGAAADSETGPAPADLEPGLWRDIGSYPATSVVITAFPRAQKIGFIISWLRGIGQGMPGWPECVGKELDKVSRYYMVQTELADGSMRPKSTLAFHGKFEKKAVSDCAGEVLSAMGVGADMKGGVETSGELTSMTMGDGKSYIWWATSGAESTAIADDDKALVSGFLSNSKRLNPDGPLVKLVAGVDRSGDLWSAGTMDYASNFLETESRGYDLSMSFLGEMSPNAPNFGVQGQARLHFDSEAAATKAKGALTKFIENMTEEDPNAKPFLDNETGKPMPPAREVLNKVLTVSVEDTRLALKFSADKDQVMVLMNKMAAVAQRVMGAN